MKKTILGYSHNPRIAKGTYMVGTSMPLDLSYNSFGTRKSPVMWQSGQQVVTRVVASERMSKGMEKELEYFPPPRRREAIEHTRRKLGL